MVLFDIMASHWAMMTWHDARLAESAAALAQLQQASNNTANYWSNDATVLCGQTAIAC